MPLNKIHIKQIDGLQQQLSKSLSNVLNVGNTASQNILMGNYSIGLGTSTPTTNLHVDGGFRYVDGNESTGYVLTSDGNGLASWSSLGATGTDLTGLGVDNRIARWNGTDTLQNSDWFINDSGVLYPNTDVQDIGISGTNRIGNIYMGGGGFGGESSIVVATGSFGDRFKINTEGGTTLFEINTSDNSSGLGNVGIGTITGNDGRLSVKAGAGHVEIFTISDENDYNIMRTFNSNGNVQFGTSSNITIIGGGSTLAIPARLGIRGNSGENTLRILHDTGAQIINLDNDTKTFDLGASTTANFRYNDGSQGTDYVLTSDINGNATWKDVGSLGGSGSTPVSVTGTGTDNHITRWNGTSTTVVQDSGVIIDDGDNISGVNNMTVDGSIVVQGNFTINGTTSTINTQNLLVEDPLILLASTQSGTPTLDSGLMVSRGSGMTQSFIWDESEGEFAMISTNDSHETQGNVSIVGYSTLRVGGFKLTDGSEANGYILISDSNGVASWTASSGIGSTVSVFTDLSDVSISGAVTDQTLRYNGTNWVNQSDLNISSTGEVGIGTVSSASYSLNVGGDVNIDGTLYASSKSFDIVHPSDSTKRLRYGSLEGPEYGVYFRGKLDNDNKIILPVYWKDLVHEDTITVQLTPYGRQQDLYVGNVTVYEIEILGDDSPQSYYNIYAERKDIPKIISEIKILNKNGNSY